MDAYNAFLAGQPVPPRDSAARRLLARWRAEWEAERPRPTPAESEARLDALNLRFERMAQRVRAARACLPRTRPEQLFHRFIQVLTDHRAVNRPNN